MRSTAATTSTAALGSAATPTSPLRFKRLGAIDSDELSILALMQDRQGFIWIGTHSGGLYRYNGSQEVRRWLETYVESGGTLIVLAQADERFGQVTVTNDGGRRDLEIDGLVG